MTVMNCDANDDVDALPNTNDHNNKDIDASRCRKTYESELTSATTPLSSRSSSPGLDSRAAEDDSEEDDDEEESSTLSPSLSFDQQQPFGFAELDRLVQSLDGSAPPPLGATRMSKPHQRQRSRRSFSFSSSPLSTIHEDDLLASTSSSSSSPHSLSFSGVMPIGRLDDFNFQARTRAFTSPPRMAIRGEEEEDEERRDDEYGLATKTEIGNSVVDSNRCDSEASPWRSRCPITPTTMRGVVFGAEFSNESNDEHSVPPPPSHPLHRSDSDKTAPDSISPRRIDDEVVFLTNVPKASSRHGQDGRRKMRIPQLSSAPPPPPDSPSSQDGKPLSETGSPLSSTATDNSTNWLPSAMSLLALAHDSDDDDWNETASSASSHDPWKKDEADPVILSPPTPDPRRGKLKKGHRRQRSMDWSLPLESSYAPPPTTTSPSCFVIQNSFST